MLLAGDEPDQQSFDNVASVLSVSPALLDNYLSAAYRVSAARAWRIRRPARAVETYTVPLAWCRTSGSATTCRSDRRVGSFVPHHFPADGEYTIKVTLRRQLYLYIVGMGEPHEMDVRIDGQRVTRFTIGGEGQGPTAPESFAGNTQGDPRWEVYMHTADDNLRVRVPVTAGRPRRRRVVRAPLLGARRHPAAAAARLRADDERAVSRQSRGGQRGDHRTAARGAAPAPVRGTVAVREPQAHLRLSARQHGRRRDAVRPPDPVEPVASRAYRRPVTDARHDDARCEFYRAGRADGDFEDGIERGLERILAAPSFLFRVVREPAAAGAGLDAFRCQRSGAGVAAVVLPVEQPARRAAADRRRQGPAAHDPAVLRRQVRRMLSTIRARRALVEGFAIQWLKLGKVAGVVPDVDAFPDFDENLRRAMLDETRAFIASQLREDRRVTELITADYSYVNERLAKHYRIPNVYGSHLRRVSFPDGTRGGLLGQAAVLTATSYPNRTSPVLRGKWLLDNILGSPMPAPPADVPSLDESGAKDKPQSIREQMEAHRRNPTCATCHVRMDPLGFSLENFDALGKWRRPNRRRARGHAATHAGRREVRRHRRPEGA